MVVILEQVQIKSSKKLLLFSFYFCHNSSHWVLYFFSLHALCECSCSSASLLTYHVACGSAWVHSGNQEEGSAAVQGQSKHVYVL